MFMTRVMLRRVPPPHIIHGVLSTAFPGKRNETINENLWRIDIISEDAALIIVSTTAPDLEHIVREIGKNDEKNKTLDYSAFLARVAIGQGWHFRFRANPVEHKKVNPTDKRGRIFASRNAKEQLEWLERQSTKYGFRINSCIIAGDEWKLFQETDKKHRRNMVRFRAITFDGSLTVEDAAAFRMALCNGIGRSKAYGCGLLTIAGLQR